MKNVTFFSFEQIKHLIDVIADSRDEENEKWMKIVSHVWISMHCSNYFTINTDELQFCHGGSGKEMRKKNHHRGFFSLLFRFCPYN